MTKISTTSSANLLYSIFCTCKKASQACGRKIGFRRRRANSDIQRVSSVVSYAVDTRCIPGRLHVAYHFEHATRALRPTCSRALKVDTCIKQKGKQRVATTPSCLPFKENSAVVSSLCRKIHKKYIKKPPPWRRSSTKYMV